MLMTSLPPPIPLRDLGTGALLVRAVAAAVVTIAFTVLARKLHGVTPSGGIAGATVAFILYMSAGPGAFVALVSVFVLALAGTRFGYSRKVALGTAERRSGRRASQVIANLGIATLSALAFAITRAPLALLAMTAGFAEAAADTVSSECGQALSAQARLITTWRSVRAGVDGGVTLAGTIAGAAAGLFVCVVCSLLGQIPYVAIAVAWMAAIAGMFVDSVLGGTLERRERLNNDQVNFLSTAAAAAIALVLYRVWP